MIKCYLCKPELETIYHVFFNCNHVQYFWKECEYYFYSLREIIIVYLTLRDVINGIINYTQNALCYIIWFWSLNYVYLWGCRRSQNLPSITALISKVKIMNETEMHMSQSWKHGQQIVSQEVDSDSGQCAFVICNF